MTRSAYLKKLNTCEWSTTFPWIVHLFEELRVWRQHNAFFVLIITTFRHVLIDLLTRLTLVGPQLSYIRHCFFIFVIMLRRSLSLTYDVTYQRTSEHIISHHIASKIAHRIRTVSHIALHHLSLDTKRASTLRSGVSREVVGTCKLAFLKIE
jgi:hypothetical protein